ncbi:MAG: helix-turn-helix transcriptional regulator [Ruminococcaceae bacterium]|nr:helix-turn-helix transcriptional regulator [Oscillospiraceae bacterium]
MSRRHLNTTKLEIIQVATEMFVNNGYSNTSIKAIADELGLSTGHVTFYFPTKEHLLAVLVEMLCGFQWSELRHNVEEGKTSLFAICIELAVMVSTCETNEIAKDFYRAAYTHSIPLDIIRKNDIERAKIVFSEYCPDWTDEDFRIAETLVSGVEYSSMAKTDNSPSLENRIIGAINNIMTIYNVPEEVKKININKILSLDFVNLGKNMLNEFSEYVKIINEQTLEEMFN